MNAPTTSERAPGLQSVTFVRWKSVAAAEMELSTLTLLVGTNASGKSNVIEGLKLLQWMARGIPFTQYPLNADRRPIRGTPDSFVNVQSAASNGDFGFDCRVGLDSDTDPLMWSLRLKAAPSDATFRVETETLTSEGSSSRFPLYQAFKQGEVGNLLRVDYNNFARGGKKPSIDAVDTQPVFAQLQVPSRFAATRKTSQATIPPACVALQHHLQSMLFLDPEPASMRQWSPVAMRELAGDGHNISSVLYALCQESADSKAQVLEFVRALPDQDITDVLFDSTSRNEVMLKLEESFGGQHRPVDITLLSDGTLRVLAIAGALLAASPGTTVVIEEIDNGVHPSRARQLLQNIRSTAERRGLRVLITTHNPALMNALPPEAIGDVVLCYRTGTETNGNGAARIAGTTSLTRLRDLPGFTRIVTHGSLGQSAADGVLEREATAHPPGSEEAPRFGAWLDEFFATSTTNSAH
jgi:hypothetical protein